MAVAKNPTTLLEIVVWDMILMENAKYVHLDSNSKIIPVWDFIGQDVWRENTPFAIIVLLTIKIEMENALKKFQIAFNNLAKDTASNANQILPRLTDYVQGKSTFKYQITVLIKINTDALPVERVTISQNITSAKKIK